MSSILAIAIVNNHNTPILIRTRNNTDNKNDDLLFKLHSSLDIIDEKQQQIREQYLGVLHQSDYYKIYGLCSSTNNKILLMINTLNHHQQSNQSNHQINQIRDNEARSILKTIHNIYVDVTTLNPFYLHGQTIQSSHLLKKIDELFG